jgi:hypothetical protein
VATATPTQSTLKAISRHTTSLALWHLLSLDAPTVAVLWTWFVATTTHVRLPISSALAMAITVWMLYAADRLMDARLLQTNSTHLEDLEARHFFHHRHRPAFLAGILLASIALALLLPRLDTAAISLYLVLGGFVSGYFLLIHATQSAHRLPKEIAVGFYFAAATFIPTVATLPALRLPLLPSALLFATLCSLNCLFIYAWEHADRHTNRPTHTITRFALSHLPLLTIFVIVVSAALSLFDRHAPWPIPCATAISATLLLVLHHRRHSITRITLRAAADLALTTPILLVPFLR